MQRRLASFRLPAWAQDALLALFITFMQVQGTIGASENSEVVASRQLTDLGHLGYVLLIVSGLVFAVRRRWPILVFLTAALVSLAYYSLGFPDGPGWLSLFAALYT